MDKRIERTRRDVLRAAIALLGDRGYAAFNMEAVAEAAGVSKSTLYRHWPTRLSLISDALETLNVQPRPAPAEGDVRQRVTALLQHLAGVLAGSTFAACLPGLLEASKHHPEVAEFVYAYNDTRRQTLIDVLREGVAAGELPDAFDPKTAALALSGALFYRRLMTSGPDASEDVEGLVALVLGAGAASDAMAERRLGR